MARIELVAANRRAAWAYGRSLREELLAKYREEFGLAAAPAPAKVVDELFPYLGASLRFEPLPLDRFAETVVVDGRPLVRVNERLRDIPGVKDAHGVENVAKWHELVHVARDLDVLRAPASAMLPGFAAPGFVCRRAVGALPAVEAREFFAEEAGRAAAVSLRALQRAEPFRLLLARAHDGAEPVAGAWTLLYESAEAIGVNISALVKQLSLEGLIVVDGRGSGSRVYVQRPLTALDGGEGDGAGSG
ncbi:MAG TPA: hypothetical protein VNM43_03565 [Dehalococcoidia bacterium]|nr:hypothetical protein [Dehalococcoidia bacterium]